MPTAVMHTRPPEWRDEHAANLYPFADGATLTANTGEFLSDTVFLDAALYVPGAVGRLRMSQIEVRAGQVIITVGDEQLPARAVGSFDPLDADDTVLLVDSYGRSAGTLVSTADLLASFQAWPEGVRTFTVEAAEFAASCCFPVPEVGFRGFVLDDGSLFTGDIWLYGENGVVLSGDTFYLPTLDGADQAQRPFEAIRIDIVGDPLFRRRSCDGDAFQLPRFVRKIRVEHGCQAIDVVPDAAGDVKIHSGRRYVEDPAIRVHAVDGGLKIELLGSSKTDMVN